VYRIWRLGILGIPVNIDPNSPLLSTLITIPCSINDSILRRYFPLKSKNILAMKDI